MYFHFQFHFENREVEDVDLFWGGSYSCNGRCGEGCEGVGLGDV